VSFSSPSRRRLLRWAVGAVLCSGNASSGVIEALPGFRRKDPRIQTFTYRRAYPLHLAGRSIAILPFPAPQPGRPKAPDFAPFLGLALGWAFPDSVIELDGNPTGADVLIEGKVDLLHRVGAQGLKASISASVFDVSAGEPFVLWSGTKKADWIRRFPMDDCLLQLADDFVKTWTEKGWKLFEP